MKLFRIFSFILVGVGFLFGRYISATLVFLWLIKGIKQDREAEKYKRENPEKHKKYVEELRKKAFSDNPYN